MADKRPETTLFMLMSVDGKITTGDADSLDVDRDFPKISGVSEGLPQYYDLEQQTDIYSLVSGLTMAKTGANENLPASENSVCSSIVIDNKPHLTQEGVQCLMRRFKKVFIVTSNAKHPAIAMGQHEKLTVVLYEKGIDFIHLFAKFKNNFGIDRLTLQGGGTLNAQFLRQGLIDHLSVVVAPVLIGGKDTASLIDGESLHNTDDLAKVRPLKLTGCQKLDHNYIHLTYDVINTNGNVA